MNDLYKQIAELAGIPYITISASWQPDRDRNQIISAWYAWAEDDDKRLSRLGYELGCLIDSETTSLLTWKGLARAATASPEQLCRALLNAAKETSS